jgi:hypothetical protein
MESISEKVIDKIARDKISPKPKWHFLLKNYVLWSGFVFSIGIGSLAVGIIFHLANESDWDVYRYLGKGYGESIIETVPYLWIGFVFIFLGIAYYNYRHTVSGYRYCAYYIVFSSLVISFVFGYACYALGLGRSMDEMLSSKVNCYCGSAVRQKQLWSQPDKGLLSGRIVEIRIDDNFDLEDFEGQVWQIRKENDEIIYRNVIMQTNEQVKIIGRRKEAEPRVFIAKEVRPWMRGKNISEMEKRKND